MSQIKMALAAALLLVSSASQATDRFDKDSQSSAKPAAVFAIPDGKNVTFYAIEKLEPKMAEQIALAKEGKLSKSDMADLVKEAREVFSKEGKKIGTHKMASEADLAATPSRELKSTEACGRWGWGGWGYRGCYRGWGYGGCGYGYGYGGGCGAYGAAYYGSYMYRPVCGYGYGIYGGYYGGCASYGYGYGGYFYM
jgi:hypothetical protein